MPTYMLVIWKIRQESLVFQWKYTVQEKNHFHFVKSIPQYWISMPISIAKISVFAYMDDGNELINQIDKENGNWKVTTFFNLNEKLTFTDET